jgi:hypothetical protein
MERLVSHHSSIRTFSLRIEAISTIDLFVFVTAIHKIRRFIPMIQSHFSIHIHVRWLFIMQDVEGGVEITDVYT